MITKSTVPSSAGRPRRTLVAGDESGVLLSMYALIGPGPVPRPPRGWCDRPMRWTTRQDALLATAALIGGAVMLAAHSYVHWPGRPEAGPFWRAIPLLGVCAAML